MPKDKRPKFSICSPITFDRENADELRMPRYKMFKRCAKSLESQSFTDFEWVVADDLCNPPVKELSKKLAYPPDKIIRLPEKSGRIIARNAAMKAARGEWLGWLDGDDEYASYYLEALNDAIRLNPKHKIFNFNHLIISYDYKVHVRKFINMDVQGKLPFPSGTVGAGSFVFHRSVYEKIGPLPEKGLWDLANWAFKKYPKVKPFYLKNDGSGNYNSLGNPWGEDWLYFYMMTRKFKSNYLDFAPYYVHSRWGHRWPDDPEYVVDPGKKPEHNPNNI